MSPVGVFLDDLGIFGIIRLIQSDVAFRIPSEYVAKRFC